MLTIIRQAAVSTALVLALLVIQPWTPAQEPVSKPVKDAKQTPPKTEHKKTEAPKADSPPAKPDLHGDPLPQGASVRLGTTRMRHGEAVGLVKFLPDGKSMLTVAGDGVARVWDSTTGKELRRFRLVPENADNMMFAGMMWMGGAMVVGRQMNLQGMAVSDDGKLLSVVSNDASLHIWDTVAGKELRKIDNIYADGGLSEAMFTPDNKHLAVRGYDSTTRLFEVATAKKLRQIGKRPDNNNVFYGGGGMAFTPDGKTMASTGCENANGKQLWHIYLHDVASGNEINRITTDDQNGSVCPTFAPDGKTIVWSDWQGTIRIGETISGKILQEHKNSSGGYYGGEFVLSTDGRTLISRSMSGGLRMLDLASGKETKKFEKPAQQNQMFGWWGNGNRGSIAISRDGKLVALASEGNALRVMDLAAGKEREFGDGHRLGISRISHAPDGKTIYTQSQDGTLCIWDAATGKKQRQFKAPLNSHHFVLSPDGKMLLAAGMDNSVHLHDATTLKSLRKLEGAKEGIGSAAFTADGKTVGVYGAADKGAFIWIYDTETGKQKQKIKLAVAGPDANGNIMMPMVAVTGMTFSPDGRVVAATIDYQTLGIWDTETGKELPPFRAPDQKAVEGAVFTPNGRSIALALLGEDYIRLWEIASGKERKELGKKPGGRNNMGMGMGWMGGAPGQVMMPYTRPAAGMAFSYDGRLLAQGRLNDSVSIWDLSTGKEIGPVKGHSGIVDTISFAPDGKSIATGSRDTTGLVWELPKPAATADAKPPEVNVESAWKELAGDNAPQAFTAIYALASVPGPATAFLKDHLRPTAFADPSRIEQLVIDLDSEQFDVRKKASFELEKVGDAASPFLRKALEGDPSPEARKRIEEVLRKTDAAMPRGEMLRTIRAIEVLEAIGNADAKAVLQILAKGMPEAATTRAALGALARVH
jgi:WD40 repeat protein